jgi:hypothetical protein
VKREFGMPTIDRLIASAPQGELLGGLFWRAPSTSKSRTRALQEAKSLTTDATHYAQAQAGTQVRYGMYQPRASEEGIALPKATFAAAACFSRLVGAEAPNAALVLTVAAAGQRKEEKYFVVCLEDGVPVIDVLSNEVEARNALGGEDRPIWSDNPAAYPNCEPADFIVARLRRRQGGTPSGDSDQPVAAGRSCGAGDRPGRRLDAAATPRACRAGAQGDRGRRAADPAPRYLGALEAQRSRMAVDRAALVAAVDEMFSYRIWIPGWSLASAECSAKLQACTRDWVRKGGSFDDLRRALPHDALEMLVPQGGAVPALDIARTSRPVRLPSIDLPLRARPLRSLPDALSEAVRSSRCGVPPTSRST